MTVAGAIASLTINIESSQGEPVSITFSYFDKEGIAWEVKAEGFKKKTGETR